MPRIAFGKSSPRRRAAAGRVRHELLETRTLLSVSVVQPIGNVSFAQDSGAESADLYGVFADTATGQADLTFSAASDNPKVVSTSLDGAVLTLTPGAGQSGYAHITMIATDPLGDQAVDTFRIQITASTARSLDVNLGTSIHDLTFTQSNHASAKITLEGPGTAVLHFGGDSLKQNGTALIGSNQELESITLTGTTAASVLNITGHISGRQAPIIGDITSSGSLKAIDIAGADLFGDITVSGAVPLLDIAGADDGAITVGTSAKPMTLRAGIFSDENFTTSSSVGSLTATDWANTDSVPEVFSAVSVDHLSARDNFDVGLQLSGAAAHGRSLGGMSVRGSVSGVWTLAGPSVALTVGEVLSTWNATFASLPSMTVRGDFDGVLNAPSLKSFKVFDAIVGGTINLTAPSIDDLPLLRTVSMYSGVIRTAGSIGTIDAFILENGSISAGIGTLQPGQSLPEYVSDFSAASSIGSIRLLASGRTLTFMDENIAATSIGTLKLGNTQTAGNGYLFGIAARSIAHLTLHDLTHGESISLNNVKDAATLAAQLAAENVQTGVLILRIV